MANKTVTINTNKGTIIAELYIDDAPVTTGNFVDLAEKGFYNGLTFHRYEPGFVIQGGCPQGNGTGGYIDPATGRERRIQLEVKKDLKHDAAGVLAMARSQDPNSASCQFYITLAPASFLDMNYAVFGKVTEGLTSVKELRVGDKIESIIVGD
jgi:peptidyl-prolyl cis-trans isomerase B (cyclophilin B)